MTRVVSDYFARLFAGFGNGWTRFWFTPGDATTLSAMRLAIGLVAVYLHGTLLFDLTRFFGPDGLLPAADIRPLEGNTFSYLNYLSTPGELWTVHLIGLAILVLFTAGLWTRATSILALVVFLSDVHRAPMITGPTEPIVAMLLLYLCVAPCGQQFSVDRLLADRGGGATPLGLPTVELSTSATIATRLIQVHLALWVAMMGFSKLTGDTWWSGMGMWWLIARQESRLVDFRGLYQMPKLIDFWSHAVVLFELSFPLLIWIPLARPLVLAIAVAVWSSLALVTGDITFAVVLAIASMAFISPALVRSCCDSFARRRAATASD
jgi:hypothetical protein